MKRILFVLFALFATVNLAYGQTLSYNSPDPSSVILFNKLERINEGTDSVYTSVDLYMLKSFKADEDDNGFTCEDEWILQGNQEDWESIGHQDEILFFDTSCNDTYQWSFEIKENYNVGTTGNVLDVLFQTYDEDSLFHQISIIIKPMENQSEFNAKRDKLKNDALLSGTISLTPSGFYIDKPKSVSSENPQEIPNAISLDQNYPNPFNPQTTITYQIDSPQHVRLDVFNAQGQRIQTLVDGMRATGDHHISFDAAGLPSGVYVYRVQAGGEMLTRKMILVR